MYQPDSRCTIPRDIKGSICIGIRTPSASQITQYTRIKNPLSHFSDIFPRRNILLSKCFFLSKFLCRVLAVGWTLGGNCVMLEAYYPTMRLSTGCGPDNCQSIALCMLNEEDLSLQLTPHSSVRCSFISYTLHIDDSKGSSDSGARDIHLRVSYTGPFFF